MPDEGAITSGLPASGDSPVASRPDFTSLGQPQTEADHYFLRMLEQDPVKAIEVQSNLRDNFVDQIKATREGYSVGLAMLGGVRDEATYRQRRALIIERLAPLGMDAATVRQLFLALCRRYGLRPFRYRRMQRQTVLVRAPASFVRSVLHPEFEQLSQALTAHLHEITDRIIREEVHGEARDADEVAEPRRLG